MVVINHAISPPATVGLSGGGKVATKQAAKIGDKAWQVEWQEPPVTVDGEEWDIGDVKVLNRRFHNRQDALSLIKTIVAGAWGAVELHSIEFMAFDDIDRDIYYPKIGSWQEVGDGDYFHNGDDIQ